MDIICVPETYSWNMKLTDILEKYGGIPYGWEEFFEKKEVEIEKISEYLYYERTVNKATIFPEIYQVFRAFIVPPEKIRVVVVGMDPYHNGNAVGLCFSVKKGEKINPSLQNIYTELENCGYTQTHSGQLDSWVEQGCLLLNTALTVERSNAGSHIHIWYKFSELLLAYISDNTHNVAWLVMGKDAIERVSNVNKEKHRIFGTSHPVPYTARNPFRSYPAFIGSGVFTKINEYLEEMGKIPVNW